jgi:hypothetical protein
MSIKLPAILRDRSVYVSVFIISFFLITATSFAQTYYFFSSGSGNWDQTGSWLQNTSDTPSGASAASVVPDNLNDHHVRIQNGHTITMNQTASINSLNLSSGSFLVLNSAINMTVAGNVSNSGTLTSSASSIITIGGNFTNSGTFGQASGTAEVIYNGASSQNIGTATYNILTLSGGGAKTLSGNTTVNSSLALGNERLNLAGFDLTVANSSNSAISRGSGYIVSESEAAELKWVITTAAATYTYPFANSSGVYIPSSIITDGTQAGTFSIATFSSGSNFSVVPTGVEVYPKEQTVQRFWMLSTTTTTSQIDIRLSFDANNEKPQSGYSVSNGVKIQRWNSGNSNWDAPYTTSIVDNGTYHTMGANDLTTFSPFGGVNSSETLPVDLLSFDLSLKRNGIQIDWATTAEILNSGFIIQRSTHPEDGYTDVASYISSAALLGKGTTNSTQNYSYFDKGPFSSGQKYYYRLQDVDVNGNVKTHPIKEIEVDKIYSLYQNTPNPAKESTRINFSVAEKGFTILRIIDSNGKEVKKLVNTPLEPGNYYVELNSGDLKPGIYYYQMRSGLFGDQLKMIRMD